MASGEKRNTHKDNRLKSRRFINSDTIPQPKGEFKDLFRLMQEEKAANKTITDQKGSHSS